MINKSNNSWLKRTKQLWKMRISETLIFFAFALILLESWEGSGPRLEPTMALFTAIACAILLLSIKCPRCNRKPMVKILKQTNIRMLGQTMLGFDSCPYCGYTGDINDEELKQAHDRIKFPPK